MRIAGWLTMVASMVATSAASTEVARPQAALDQLAKSIGYRWQTVDNRPACPAKIDPCFLSTMTLTLPAQLPDALPTKGLALYFSFVNPLPRIDSDKFDLSFVNGDLYRLTPKPGVTLRAGASYVVKLWGVGANFSKAFPMPNAFLVADGVQARTIAATRPVIDRDTGLEVLPFVAPMTDEERLATKDDADKTRWLTPGRAFLLQNQRLAPVATGLVILPRPAKAALLAGAPLDLRGGVKVALDGVARDAVAPAIAALATAGVPATGKVPLTIRVGAATLAPEGYVLEVKTSGIAIVARDAAGASHALRSLAQQALFDKGRVRPMRVEDAPVYSFRGLHIDIGRNFHSRDQILKLIEGMAAFKLNKLHLHLADDEGWRIEIPALPELAAVGSKRCFDPREQRCLLPMLGAGPDGDSAVNGYLTTADYIAIVRAAAARQIEVIPSIDMPGHSRAAIKAMEVRYARLAAAGKADLATEFRLIDPADKTAYSSVQYYTDNTLNVCLPSTYRFVDTVVAALADMHRKAGAPLKTFHIGADETAGAWVKSPACKAMLADNGGDAAKLGPRFIERVADDLAAKGLRVAGWSDGMGQTDTARMPKTVQTNIWGRLHLGAIAEANEQMNRGWDAVLSIPDLGYFDMPYAPDPDEGGYTWATRGVDTYQVFGFMPGNLPVNAATIPTIFAQPETIEDKPSLAAGQRIMGVQAQLWSETIRTDAQVDYMLFPRLLAMAERGWSPAGWTPPYSAGASYTWNDPRVDRTRLAAEWRDFAGRVAAQFPLLDRLRIAYRIAPPGGRITGGTLDANSEFPGTRIEYRVRDGAWTRYAGPVAVNGVVELRGRSADGKRASRTVRVEPVR